MMCRRPSRSPFRCRSSTKSSVSVTASASPHDRPAVKKTNAPVVSAGADRARRSEILQTAAALIASSGLRTSLQEIADAAGILAGSLYHHFESKEAILIELI